MQVMSRAAMRHHLRSDRPALLHADHSEAIDMMVRSAFGLVCLAIMPMTSDCSMDNSDGDLLSITAVVPPHPGPMVLRLLMEQAITAHVLAEVYAGSDAQMSGTYSDEFTSLTERLRAIASMRESTHASIIPAWL